MQNTILDMVRLNVLGNVSFLIKIGLRAPSAKDNLVLNYIRHKQLNL